MTIKILLRSIKQTFGRYLAILAIVALGIGFFTGLKSAKPSMQKTADDYLTAQNNYDYRLISTLGLTEEDVAAFTGLSGVGSAEGVFRLESLARVENSDDAAFLLLSLPSQISLPDVIYGRLPENESECVLDSAAYGKEVIGNSFSLSDTTDLSRREYTVVGIVQSPGFISKDRGNTSIGNGTIKGFVYLMPEVFTSEVYHEVFIRLGEKPIRFSDEYSSLVNKYKPALEKMLSERASERYENLKNEATSSLAEARKKT